MAVDYTKPLDDPRLEAEAQIMFAGLPDHHTLYGLVRCRQWAIANPDKAIAKIAEARRQTGVDALATVLREFFDPAYPVDDGCNCEVCSRIRQARAALAAYERIAG